MRKFRFTKELIADYYDNRFASDLRAFFDINRFQGAEYVQGFKTEMYRVFHPFGWDDATIIGHSPNDVVIPHRKKRCAEEEILFIALISFMFATEEAISRRTRDVSIKEIATAMSAFGFPWLYAVDRMDLSSFLSLNHINENIWIKEEVDAIRDAMTLVEPFMLDQLIPFLKTWKGGSFCLQIRHFESFGEYLHESITDELIMFYRKRFYSYCGLLGLELTHREFEEYYTQRFPQQLKKYFADATMKGNYLKILYVPFHNNHRWEDGNPGGNAKDNFMFATLFLFMTLAEQSIIKYARESEDDFHQSTGWPIIYSGPGAGPYLHPLKMLDYAGLSPLKCEAPLLAAITKRLFPYLRQDMFAILNGKEGPMKDCAAGKRLHEAINDGKRPLIKRYILKGETDIQNLLSLWANSPKPWSEILENEGMLKM
jgi:hypothetical protein